MSKCKNLFRKGDKWIDLIRQAKAGLQCLEYLHDAYPQAFALLEKAIPYGFPYKQHKEDK